MQWVLLAVIVAALLYLSRYQPKIAFSVLGVLVVASVAIILSTTDVAKVNRSKLQPGDIVIENPVITGSYAGGFRFSARLVNSNEDFELKESAISITMLDCEDESQANCQVIGQQEERILVRIPPGQARDISRTLTFGSARPSKTLAWQFKVTNTRN